MKTAPRIRLSLLLLACAVVAVAAAREPAAGTWKTIDDETHKPASIIRIEDVNGELRGTIEKVLREGADPNEKCEKCEGDLKDKPVVGMTILRGFRARKDDPSVYDGGTVLDPRSGKTYRGKITVQDDGQHLDLRGYVGLELFGRSQTWERVQ